MQYPLAGWCQQNLPLYNADVFFNKFVDEQDPSTVDLLNLGKWLYESFPDRYIDLQDLIWTRLDGATLIDEDRLIQEIAYKAFEQRKNKSNLEKFQKVAAKGFSVLSIEKVPSCQNKPKFCNSRDLVASVFGENGFKDPCIQILNDQPDQDISIQDVVCILLNLEMFKRSFSGEYKDVPKSAAALITSVYQRTSNLYVDAQGKVVNGSENQQMMHNQAIDRAKYLEAKLKEGPHAKFHKILIDLCQLITAAFENNDENLLAQPVSELHGLFQKKGTNLSVNLCKNFLQAARNLVKLVSDEFKGVNAKKLRQILDKFYWDLGSTIAHFNVIPTPLVIFNECNKISILFETLKRNLEKFYSSIDKSQVDHWLYYEFDLDLAAIKSLISQPISCFLSHLKNALNDMVFLSDSQKTRLLPDADKLRVHLRHIYERRAVIAGIVDLYRQTKESKFQIKSKKMSGHSLHKTISDFSISPNRAKLSNLITDLKVFDNPATVLSGDFLCSAAALKRDFSDYLESCIEDSIGDAEEALESFIFFVNLITAKDYEEELHEELDALRDCLQRIGAFLETAAWLKNYYFVQKPIWELPLIDESNFKKEPLKNKPAGINTGKNKKKGGKVKKGRRKASEPFISSLKNDAPVAHQVPSAVKVSTAVQAATIMQVPIAVQVKAAVKESSSSDDEIEHDVASTSEIWKAKVEQLRSMRQMARRLKQTEQVLPAQLQETAMSLSVQEVLGGAFRRKLAGELTILRKGKVSEILKELNNDGWTLNRITGDHHIYTHPCLVGQVVIPYTSESEQLKKGTFNSIAKSAGWMDSARIVTSSDNSV